MIKTFSVSEEIEAWCTKCKLELGHTIVAIVDNLPKKVKCNTCGGQHVYRTKPAARKTSTKKTKAGEKKYERYFALLTDGNHSDAKKYSISGNFKDDEIINHSKFGTGIVTSTVKINKIEVLFKDGIKMLIQNHV